MTALPVLSKLERKESLTAAEMGQAMHELMSGEWDHETTVRFLRLLREKGETADEIAAAARAMRQHALKLSRSFPQLLDTCGTGGDAKQTLNVSTLSALVVCATGAVVAKHGNRSVSSLRGSADLLEALGVAIDLPVERVEQSIEKTGFGFFFAPRFHAATKFAMPARKTLGGKTIFNCLGPLSNPAGALYQVVGVYERRLVDLLAGVLGELGARRAIVVHGADGMDEISLCAETFVAELRDGRVKNYRIQPEDFGLERCPLESLQCASKDQAKTKALEVLEGKPGPSAEIVYLNAGAALYTAGRAASIAEGCEIARKSVRAGLALQKLNEISVFTQTAAAA